jgi:ribosomal protein S18 acetylase RimI-like enzyme
VELADDPVGGPDLTSTWVRTAHGDAWQELGRQRAGSGGGTLELPGVRLMASGLPYPQWNNGDVDDVALVDVGAVRDWYAARAVPWGVRVPSDMSWPYGRKLFAKRLMGLTAARFRPASDPGGLTVRSAAPADLGVVLAVDTVAFGAGIEVERPWMQPLLSQPSVLVAVAELNGDPVATGYAVSSRGRAGACCYVAGIGVLPHARRRGVGAAVSSWLTRAGLEKGAELVHLHPDTDSAAAIYERLGFVEVGGFDVYVDMG